MKIPGWDQSHFQRALTPATVGRYIKAGRHHAGIKASEGTYQTDPTLAQNREALRAHKVPRWLYHELTPERAEHQVARIMEATGGVLHHRELLAVVFESSLGAPRSVGLEVVRLLEHAGPVKRHHRESPGYRPPVLVYASASRWGELTLLREIPPDRRIVAEYPSEPSFGYLIHQDSATDRLTGGDHDLFNGTARHLEEVFSS